MVISEKALSTGGVRNTAAGSKENNNLSPKDRKGGDEDDSFNKKGNKGGLSGGSSNTKPNEVYTIQLRNSIGAVVDAKVLPFCPKHISMSPFHVTLTNDRTVYTWQFQSAVNRSGFASNASSSLSDDADTKNDSTSPGRMLTSKVRMFDIQNTSFSTAQSPETFNISSETIADPILCSTIKNVYTLREREPIRMEFNCASSKLGVIDSNGIFTILDLEARVSMDGSNKNSSQEGGEKDAKASKDDAKYGANLGPTYGRKLNVDRKDVWDMKWSEDDADMVVVMEKTKMVVFNHETPEDPCISSGYLARFKDLEIRVVTLDNMMQAPDKVTKDCVVDFESKSLREVRDKITAEGLNAGYAYAEKHSHPRLWKLLANA
eukprot:gene33480-41320_t